ncbi:MAG TPA: hypothetical protein VFU71_06400 [Burkholderiaceae bacterium]|nr:hypothetical protein [Burkholderiaceae bacterium]
MKRLSIAIAAAVGVSIAAPLSVSANDKAAKPAAKPAQQQVATLSADQLSTADRVLVGQSRCEFDQSVNVAAVPGQKGWFNVEYKGKSYLMAPEHTTTGAVRLEDKKNGMMWLQIANKSMLMNSKIGQRMVDNCVHPSQKT